VQAYARLGIEPMYSCTPYLAGNRPRKGQHIAWAESSATVFANSYLGAFTNREGGPSALAAALVGKTPEYGLHLEENRRAKVEVTVEAFPEELAPIAGYVVGGIAGRRIPHVVNLSLSEDGHKAFGAAMAATSAVSMYTYSKGRDRARTAMSEIEERVSLPVSELNRSAEDLRGGESWDLVAIGCPHYSPKELRAMARTLKNRKPARQCEAWFCTSRSAYARCPKEVAILKRFGKVLCDTCMVVAPIEERFRSTASDSGKAMVYLPTLGRQRASFRTRKSLLEAVSR
jgi:predicted aconitase